MVLITLCLVKSSKLSFHKFCHIPLVAMLVAQRQLLRLCLIFTTTTTTTTTTTMIVATMKATVFIYLLLVHPHIHL